MSLHIDLKYTNLLACHFEKFTRKSDYLFNVRCPLCGDSQTKKTKMRGYIYRDKQRLAYKCHNCNVSTWLGALIKKLAPELYKEYAFETFTEKSPRTLNTTKPQLATDTMRFGDVDQVIYENAERVDRLHERHPCRVYVQQRLIPQAFWSKLYYAEHYLDFLNEVAPNHGKDLKNDARLVIPYYDAYGAVLAVTGRALENGPKVVRYITVRTTVDTNKLVYGRERVDQSKTVHIVEGPLDSLFLHNAVASGDSNLIQTAKNLSAAKVVLVYDNEPRQRENIYQIEKAIKEGYDVVIWPEHIKEKDLNAMVLAGRRPSEVQEIIHSHVYRGLTALTHLAFWKKLPNKKGI